MVVISFREIGEYTPATHEDTPSYHILLRCLRGVRRYHILLRCWRGVRRYHILLSCWRGVRRARLIRGLARKEEKKEEEKSACWAVGESI